MWDSRHICGGGVSGHFNPQLPSVTRLAQPEGMDEEDDELSPIVRQRKLKRRRNPLDSTPDTQPAGAGTNNNNVVVEEDNDEEEADPDDASPMPKRSATGGAKKQTKLRGFGHRIFDVEARTGRRRRTGTRRAHPNRPGDADDEEEEDDEESEEDAEREDDEEEGSEDLDADLEGFVVSDNCNDSQLYDESAPNSESGGSGGSSCEADPYLQSLLSQAPAHMQGRRGAIQDKFAKKGVFGKGNYLLKWDVKAENHMHLDDESSEGMDNSSEAFETDEASSEALEVEEDNQVSAEPSRQPSPRRPANVAAPLPQFQQQQQHQQHPPPPPLRAIGGMVGGNPVPVLSRIIMPRGGDYESKDCSLQFERILKLAGTGFTD